MTTNGLDPELTDKEKIEAYEHFVKNIKGETNNLEERGRRLDLYLVISICALVLFYFCCYRGH
jgi:hypothetical protein